MYKIMTSGYFRTNAKSTGSVYVRAKSKLLIYRSKCKDINLEKPLGRTFYTSNHKRIAYRHLHEHNIKMNCLLHYQMSADPLNTNQYAEI